MDEYVEKSRSSCGCGPIAFMASVQALGNLPQCLSSSGRFDFHIQLPAPAVSERGAMLKHEIQKRALQCSEDILAQVASKCDGYDAYDLGIVVISKEVIGCLDGGRLFTGETTSSVWSLEKAINSLSDPFSKYMHKVLSLQKTLLQISFLRSETLLLIALVIRLGISNR